MKQKYKFFIRQKAIIITSDADFTTEWWLSEKEHSSEKIMNEILEQFNLQQLEEDYTVWVKDVNQLLDSLLSKSEVIIAGGGFVLNKMGQLLMIHRRGFWDLPKGKLEPGETIETCAIREVEEECGVRNLSIISKQYTTFHLYKEERLAIVKQSVWFKMETDFEGNLHPQIEEDINRAEWVNLPVPAPKLEDAYPLITDVINYFSMA